jgi:hypothetical protein
MIIFYWITIVLNIIVVSSNFFNAVEKRDYGCLVSALAGSMWLYFFIYFYGSLQ